MPVRPRRRPGDSTQTAERFQSSLSFLSERCIVMTLIALNRLSLRFDRPGDGTTSPRSHSAQARKLNWETVASFKKEKQKPRELKHPRNRAAGVGVRHGGKAGNFSESAGSYMCHLPLRRECPPRPLCLSPTSCARELFFGLNFEKHLPFPPAARQRRNPPPSWGNTCYCRIPVARRLWSRRVPRSVD